MKHFICISSLLAALSLVACDSMLRYQPRRIHFYSPDKQHAFTVMDNLELDHRYVVNGRVSHYPPDSNYVKLDASRLPYFGECIWVCWDENGLDWEVAVAKTSILENKLDTTRFRVNTSLPVDSLGIPTEKKYRKENCAIFSFYDKALSPDERGAIIEFHHK